MMKKNTYTKIDSKDITVPSLYLNSFHKAIDCNMFLQTYA